MTKISRYFPCFWFFCFSTVNAQAGHNVHFYAPLHSPMRGTEIHSRHPKIFADWINRIFIWYLFFLIICFLNHFLFSKTFLVEKTVTLFSSDWPEGSQPLGVFLGPQWGDFLWSWLPSRCDLKSQPSLFWASILSLKNKLNILCPFIMRGYQLTWAAGVMKLIFFLHVFF